MELEAQKFVKDITLKWDNIAQLPPEHDGSPNLGVAGPVAGVAGDVLIVAGGANFPDNPPWQGGKKAYHDEIYILRKSNKKKYEYIKAKTSVLGFPIAYPANVAYKKGFISVGGENSSGVLKSVLYFEWIDKDVRVTRLPDLPYGITACGAVCIGDKLYVAGGNLGKASSSSLLVLDLSHQDKKWTELAKMPFALENVVTTVCHDGESKKLFLIGGRFKAQHDQITTFSDKILKYDPKSDTWTTLDFVTKKGESLKLAAGTGVQVARNKILLIGGDKGLVFNRIESLNNLLAQPELENREKVLNEKLDVLTQHKGFDTDVYVYDATSNICKKIGAVPGLTQVTTTAFYWGKLIIIPSGEVKPGVRTSEINSINVIKE